jgi:hypothetical protein
MPPKGKKGNGKKGPLVVGPRKEQPQPEAAPEADDAAGLAEALDD